MRVCLLESSSSMDKGVLIWLAERKEIEQIQYLKSEAKLMSQISCEPPDVVVIHLGTNKNHGLKIGEEIICQGESIQIVFISDSTCQALDAFDVGAAGYLVEPLEKSKFEICFDNLEQNN